MMKKFFCGIAAAATAMLFAATAVAGPATYQVPNFGPVIIDGDTVTIGEKTYEMGAAGLAGSWYVNVSADGRSVTITNNWESSWTSTGRRDDIG